MWGRQLLLVAFLLTRGVVAVGQHCTSCQQVDCRPLPSNCKYGVTLDHCGCCKICVQSNGERCRFIPDTNGVGFMCEWGSSTSDSKRIGDMIASQFHRPPGLDAFLRAFFNDIPSPFHDRAEVLWLNGPAKHFELGREDAKHSDGPKDAKHSTPNFDLGLEDAKHSDGPKDAKHSAPKYVHGPEEAKNSDGPKDTKHSALNPEDTEATVDVEYNKAYPTCGLYDYLTSTATSNHHEISTEKVPKTSNRQVYIDRFNSRLSSQKNWKRPFVDSKRFIAEAMRKTNEITNRKELQMKNRKQEKGVEERLRFKKKAVTFINALKHVDGTGDASIVRQYKNVNSDRQGIDNGAYISNVPFVKYGGPNEETVIQVSNKALSERNAVEADVEMINTNGDRGKLERPEQRMKEVNSLQRVPIVKTSEVGRFLGETIADIITMLLNRARTKHSPKQDVAGTTQNKSDQIKLLRNMLEKKQRAKGVSAHHDATNAGDQISGPNAPVSSLLLKSQNVFSNLIIKDLPARILSRKIIHDKNKPKADGGWMDDGEEVPSKGVEGDYLASNTRGHTRGVAASLDVAKMAEEDEDGGGDVRLVDEPGQGLEVNDEDWNGRYLEESGRSLQRPSSYFIQKMLHNHDEPRVFARAREEADMVKRKLLSRKKRSAPIAEQDEVPVSYGKFKINKDGAVEISSDGNPNIEPALSLHFPDRKVISKPSS